MVSLAAVGARFAAIEDGCGSSSRHGQDILTDTTMMTQNCVAVVLVVAIGVTVAAAAAA